MNQKLRIIFRILSVFVVAFVAVQPYNWYCRTHGKCSQFYFEDLLPDFEGKAGAQLIFEVKNYRPDVEIKVAEPQMINTVTGKRNVITYRIENLSNHAVRFRPEFYVEPQEFKKYISLRECLCFREQIIKKGEITALQSVFKIRSAAQDYLHDARSSATPSGPIRIGYIIR